MECTVKKNDFVLEDLILCPFRTQNQKGNNIYLIGYNFISSLPIILIKSSPVK